MWNPFSKNKRERFDLPVLVNNQVGYVMSSTYGNPNVEQILPMFQSYAEQAYASNSVVFTAILARMSLFTEVEFQFEDKKKRSLFGLPDLEILENPWPGGTTGDLLCRMEQDVSLAGNAYVRLIPEANRLERLRPDWVYIISDTFTDDHGREYREVTGYTYDRNGDQSLIEHYSADEVAHWSPIPDPCANFRGMSWLTPVIREIFGDQMMTEYKIHFLKNNATPNVMVKYQPNLPPSVINSIEDRINAKFGGPGNAGKSMVVDGGADLTIVGSNFQEMAFTAVQEAGENRILMASGVPSIVAGAAKGLDASTYSNYGLAMRKFADTWARPQWRSACSALETIVNVPSNARLWYDASRIAALQDSEQLKAEAMATKASAAVSFVQAGFTADSVTAALTANDLNLLKHSGLIPTTLYDPNKEPPHNVVTHEQVDAPSGPDISKPANDPTDSTDTQGNSNGNGN